MTAEAPDTGQTRPRRCPLWVKIALVISLVLNVAVIGLVAGQAMKGERKGRGTTGQIRWILTFVPEARQDAARAFFETRRDEIRDLYRARGKTMDEIVDAIRAEPFAPETLEAAIARRTANSTARRAIVEGGLVKLLSEFTPAERIEFADRMAEKLEAWKKRRRKRR